MKSQRKTLNQEIATLAGGFLFDTPSEESESLDMRTRINSASQLKTMMYYGILAGPVGCENAKLIKDLMQRLFISAEQGKGRSEAVDVLRQNLPKKVEIEKGYEESEF